MCDKYAIFSRGDVYEARNKHTHRRYARYKALPRHWRELRRDGTSTVDNDELINTLEAAVCEFVTPAYTISPCSDRPRGLRAPILPPLREPVRRSREQRDRRQS